MVFRLVPVNHNALFSKYLGQYQLQQGVKLIVPPALALGAQEDQTSPWLVIAGDPGCPVIVRHFLARAEQSSGLFPP